MALGDQSVQVVTAPIDATSIGVAINAALVATSSNANLIMTSFNDGRGLVIVAVEQS